MAEQPLGRAFRHRYEGPFFRKLLIGGVRAMSPAVRRFTMPFWARIFHTVVPDARHVIEHNLTQVLGPLSARELRRRSFDTFLHYAQALSNMYALYEGLDSPVTSTTIGGEHLLRLHEEKRGAVVVTGHMGLWQIAPFLMAKKKYPPMTMAMAEEPNRATAQFEDKLRAQLRIVYTTRSPFSTLALANTIRKGELVGMQMDRHMGGPHALIDFFGRPAAFPLGPATLARVTESPLIPVFIVSNPERTRCTFFVENPITVERTDDKHADILHATQRCVAIYERYVRQYPDQWFNFFDFWRTPQIPARPVDDDAKTNDTRAKVAR